MLMFLTLTKKESKMLNPYENNYTLEFLKELPRLRKLTSY